MNIKTITGHHYHQRVVSLGRVLLGVALVGASAWLCYNVFAVNATTAGLVFLVEILLFAAGWGLFEALSAAVAAVLLLNYLFLPPVGHFTIADPQNWVALFAFLITAIVASHLSATIRKQAREAVKRREEMGRLYSFSRAILLTGSDQPIGAELAVQAVRILESAGIAIFDAQNDKTHLGGLWDTGPPEELLRAAAVHGTYSRGRRGNLGYSGQPWRRTHRRPGCLRWVHSRARARLAVQPGGDRARTGTVAGGRKQG